MQLQPRTDLTQVLTDLSEQSPRTLNEIMPVIYEDLHAIAHSKLVRESHSTTFQTTELVQEAYLKLRKIGCSKEWESPGHFCVVAAETMRRILIDRARARKRIKRGGDAKRECLEAQELAVTDDCRFDVLDLDEALCKLEQTDSVQFEIVRLRYFAGLTIQQTSQVMGLAPSSVYDHWCCARAWLFDQLSA